MPPTIFKWTIEGSALVLLGKQSNGKESKHLMQAL